ncbi:O-methyltransferase [Staphylococcus schleiferi]|uniref:tRNA 5-hydroxyuridine methyltransferase n=1 Tax=Staphylococcus schleiferi TaxID=1295 RepID=A0A7Z7QPM6_STASC|nr:O-methyltransferase [Staphylococcus schleiferi]RTX82332.1 O-methyltransferase [Staphylococcus schleiferi subsp. schleiferi]CAD7359585.1 O-methyltransferase family protein [Staphylococcus schleiferi]SUM88634.1 O-methyltransferase family protein [Staphylococcus schleiferi]
MEDNNQNYLLSLQNYDSPIDALRSIAEKNNVPIIDQLSLDLIKQLIRIHNSKHILEIGSAIGYSAMQFASVNSDIQITTIERNEAMIQEAKANIENLGYQSQIRLIEADATGALELVNDQSYDMIFIDAAKAQSQRFFEIYSPLLREKGVIITDNVLYHGFVANIDVVKSRNVKQMVKKVQKYNAWLSQREDYSTNFVHMDDGLAISIKESKND